MSLIAWMAVYRPSENRWGFPMLMFLYVGFGQTGSFYLPPIIVEKVNSRYYVFGLLVDGIELGVADDQVFGVCFMDK